MIAGSYSLPLKHLTIRVPWHDLGWTGRVCANPLANTSCTVLNRIAQVRDEVHEATIRGSDWIELGMKLPPCAQERGGFMSETGYERVASHPYATTSNEYKHFRATPFRHEP